MANLKYLEAACVRLNNWFTVMGGVYSGAFSFVDGQLENPPAESPEYLTPGVFVRIAGSKFNDGVYVWPLDGMTDEKFTGTVSVMRPPRAFLDLIERIEAEDSEATPYVSESFAGYSYTKATNAAGVPLSAWGTHKGELNRWRKL